MQLLLKVQSMFIMLHDKQEQDTNPFYSFLPRQNFRDMFLLVLYNNEGAFLVYVYQEFALVECLLQFFLPAQSSKLENQLPLCVKVS